MSPHERAMERVLAIVKSGSQTKAAATLGLSEAMMSALLSGKRRLSNARAAAILAHVARPTAAALPIMKPGSGPQPDCVNRSACLNAFVKARPSARACHCPAACSRLSPPASSVEMYTRTGLSSLAGFR